MRTTKPQKYGAGPWLSASLIIIWAGFFVPGLSNAIVYGDNHTKRYHTGECAEQRLIEKKNLYIFISGAEAGSKGFYPCRICMPSLSRPALKTERKRQLSLPIVRGREYVGDIKTHIYHYYWCPLIKKNKHIKKVYFKTVKAAAKKGYAPCRECHPPGRKAPEYSGRVEPSRPVSPEKVKDQEKIERDMSHAREAAQRIVIKEQAQESIKQEALESLSITEEDDE